MRAGGRGAERAISLWDEIEAEGEQGTFGLYTAEDERWTIARITALGGSGWPKWPPTTQRSGGAGVSILHRLVIDTLLVGPRPSAHGTVRLGSRTCPPCAEIRPRIAELAAAYGRATPPVETSPARRERRAVRAGGPGDAGHGRAHPGDLNAGERMPAKSTYFYPKLLSGLVINPLE